MEPQDCASASDSKSTQREQAGTTASSPLSPKAKEFVRKYFPRFDDALQMFRVGVAHNHSTERMIISVYGYCVVNSDAHGHIQEIWWLPEEGGLGQDRIHELANLDDLSFAMLHGSEFLGILKDRDGVLVGSNGIAFLDEGKVQFVEFSKIDAVLFPLGGRPNKKEP